MIILGLDFETTWELDTSKSRVIEVGAVLWDTDTQSPLKLMNELISESHEIDPELTKLTGITSNTIVKHGLSGTQVFGDLVELIEKAEYIAAHNGNEFDKPILEHELERYRIKAPSRTWIDTRIDIDYPDHIGTRKLQYLACEHGFVNPFSHRAVFDVLTMLNVLGVYDIKEVIENAKQPTIELVAHVSFKDKDLAKDMGFHWRSESKQWYLRVKKNKALAIENQAGFEITKQEL